MSVLMYKIMTLNHLLPMQTPPDDVWESDPNASLLSGAQPLLRVAAGLGLAALVVVGFFLLITGVPSVFVNFSNPAKLRSSGLKVVGGIGALIMAYYGWRVLGNLVNDVVST